MRILVSLAIALMAALLIMLSGCAGGPTPSPSPEAKVATPSPEEVTPETSPPATPITEETPTEEATLTAPPESPTAPFTPTPTLVPIPTFTPTPAPEPEGVVNAEPYLNLRRGPSTEEAILANLATGTKVRVKGKDESGKWLSVSADQGDGWVYAEYISLNVPLENIPLAKISSAAPPTSPAPAKPAVDSEIEALAAGEHGNLLPPWEVGPVSAGGKAEIVITNDSPYNLTILLSQPASVSTSLDACPHCAVYELAPESCPEDRPTKTIRLDPGTLKIVIRPDTPDFPPYIGEWGLLGDMKYTYCFFVVK
ncbi:MAG: SH3 domain-containing protein [Anaerolineae bacterium]